MRTWITKTLLSGCCLLAAALPTASHAVDTYTQTRYPVVLVHGLFGFDAIGPVDYWYGMPQSLRASGATVYVSQQSAANSSEVRGEQLLAELRRLKATYGHTRFNLVGHSHGGHTIRYVAGVAPELVASATSIGSPHAGSRAADDIVAALDGTGSTSVAAGIINALAKVISVLSGAPALPQNSEAAARSLTTAGSAAFTARFPAGKPTTACGQGAGQVGAVRYYSYSGTRVLTNALDPVDGALLVSSASVRGEANDGLVSRCSSHWGTVLRDDSGWNHLDEVNQSFGLRGLFAADPVAVLRTHVNRLKLAGL